MQSFCFNPQHDNIFDEIVGARRGFLTAGELKTMHSEKLDELGVLVLSAGSVFSCLSCNIKETYKELFT
jgi:hypothetical protein